MYFRASCCSEVATEAEVSLSSSQKNSRSKPSVVRKTLATKTKAGDSGKADSAPPRKPRERVERNSDVGWNGRVIVATKDVAWEEVGTARWRIARRIALNEVTARQSLDAGNKFPLNSVTTSSEAKEGVIHSNFCFVIE